MSHPKQLLPRLLEDTDPEPRVTAVRTSPGVEEQFLTFHSEEQESSREFLARIETWRHRHNSAIISQTLIAPHEKHPEYQVYRPEWPLTWIVEDRPCYGERYQSQVWTISGVEPRPIWVGGGICGSLYEDEDFHYLRLGGLLPNNASTCESDQTAQVFEQMRDGLSQAGMTFRNVARTWYYNRDILSWYGDFNRTRNRFFQEAKVYEGVVPASTGIGAKNPAGAALTAGLLAVRAKHENAQVIPVLSPLQNSALDYGSSFSRAVELGAPASRRLLVSGTASIGASGETVHLGDERRQIERTFEVVREILLSRGMDWAHVVRAHAFLRNPSALPKLSAFLERFLPEVPFAISGQTICREDLLFEVEVDAIFAL